MTVWPTNNTMPTIYSWYVGVQRQLPAKFSLDLSYSGNHAVHLMDQRQLNALPAGTFISNPNLSKSVNCYNNALLPYLGWGNLNAVETLGYSRYNAMMLRVSRRFANNLSVNFNYTYSKIMDIVDNDSDQINNPFNIRAELRAGRLRPAERSHPGLRLHAAEGEGIAGPAHPEAGFQRMGTQRHDPVAIGHAAHHHFQREPDGSERWAAQYANLTGDAYAGQNSFQWLNQAAFTRPAEGSYGSLARNALRMPGVRNVDANLVKNFNFTEAAKVQFRCEVFNLFNHPQVWGINTGFSGDNPGSAISDERQEFRAGEFLSRCPNSATGSPIQLLILQFEYHCRKPRYRRIAGLFCGARWVDS